MRGFQGSIQVRRGWCEVVKVKENPESPCRPVNEAKTFFKVKLTKAGYMFSCPSVFLSQMYTWHFVYLKTPYTYHHIHATHEMELNTAKATMEL